jgi:ribosomal protein S18 acetylase RimI-like enzyme
VSGPDFRIRRAEPADASELARLAEQTFRDAFASQNAPADIDSHCLLRYGSAQQSREIEDPSMSTLLVEQAGRLIAFGQLRVGTPPSCVAARRATEIQRLYVDQGWHGKGVAQALISTLIAQAMDRGADGLWLGVWERNPRAIAFYEKFGFRAVGEHIFMVGSDPQRDLIMQLLPATRAS